MHLFGLGQDIGLNFEAQVEVQTGSGWAVDAQIGPRYPNCIYVMLIYKCFYRYKDHIDVYYSRSSAESSTGLGLEVQVSLGSGLGIRVELTHI